MGKGRIAEIHKHTNKQRTLKIYCDNITQTSTICPRSNYPFNIVTYYIKWVTSSWTYSIKHAECVAVGHHRKKKLRDVIFGSEFSHLLNQIQKKSIHTQK